MQLHDIQEIGIIGAGQMGAGIGMVSAKAGWKVLLIDTNTRALDAARARIKKSFDKQIQEGITSFQEADQACQQIRTSRSLRDIVDVQLVIEAVPEQPDLKSRLFTELGMICKPDVIFASNTSSISITKLGASAGRGELVAGMHFMNPVPVMRLVEITRGLRTTSATISCLSDLAKQLGKTPVTCKDSPGFIVNRILIPMLNEAIFAFAEGVATAEAIDLAMMCGTNHPMGPLALADRIGLDTVLSICEVLYEDFGDPKFRPCPLLRQYVETGWLGRKSGRGFYNYQEQ